MEPSSTRLAAAYERAHAAVDNQGEVDSQTRGFATWLARHWVTGPRQPVRPADAVSVDRLGRLTMRWFTHGAVILGFATGSGGCYVVPVEELSHLESTV